MPGECNPRRSEQSLLTQVAVVTSHSIFFALVAQAYGWSADLTDVQILTRLVALNTERAAEEARGLFRWLRPKCQAPDYAAPISQSLDLGDAAAVVPGNVIPWPVTLSEQFSALQQVLSVQRGPTRSPRRRTGIQGQACSNPSSGPRCTRRHRHGPPTRGSTVCGLTGNLASKR